MAEKPKIQTGGNKRKIACPECDTEVELVADDDGDVIGKCGNCKLDVGRIYTRRRYDAANAKITEEENKAKEGESPAKKKSGWTW